MAEIRKALKRFPGNRTLLNYLQIAYQISGQHRQADATLKELAELHPDYLFARLGLAIKALEQNDNEKVRAQLGPDLDVRALYPDREIFHVSELANYYKLVAIIHARSGKPDLALGAKAAITAITDDPQAEQVITYEVMRANMAKVQDRMRADDHIRIEVRIPPFQKKSIPRESIRYLYEFGLEIPEDRIRAILALPRQTLLGDLARALDDCAAHSANFMRQDVEESDDHAAFHALHLLAEIDGHEALDSLLRILSLHPEAFDFWLGDHRNYAPQIARIIAGDLQRCAVFLKSAGIHSRHKAILIEAMEQLAKSDSNRLDEVVSTLEESLAFILESPKADNILDTHLICHLIAALTGLRASRSLSVIKRAYQKNLVELFLIGGFEEIALDITNPIRTAEKFLPILAQYREYEREASPPAEKADLIGNPFGIPQRTTSTASAGRNDPCPCGSGKKYKKCCMK